MNFQEGGYSIQEFSKLVDHNSYLLLSSANYFIGLVYHRTHIGNADLVEFIYYTL